MRKLPAVHSEKGREFQIIGPVTVKALSPNVFKLVLGTINNLESWDLIIPYGWVLFGFLNWVRWQSNSF